MGAHWFTRGKAPAPGLLEPWERPPGKLAELQAALAERFLLPPRLSEQILAAERESVLLPTLLDRIVITAYACLGPAALTALFEVEDRTGVRWGLAPRALEVEVKDEASVQEARIAGTRLATRLGFGAVTGTKVGTAVSELARNVRMYAGRGRVSFTIDPRTRSLRILVEDRGPGIPDLAAVFDGTHTSKTGLGMGLRGVRAIANDFHIDSRPGLGTRVEISFHPRV